MRFKGGHRDSGSGLAMTPMNPAAVLGYIGRLQAAITPQQR
jgi:hypothetical protein